MTAGEVTGAAVSPGNGEPAGGGGSAQKARRGRSSLAVPQLEVGMRVMRRWGDQELHPVTIVERRRIPFCGDNYEYYIRYNKLNRRHDEWVKLEQLDLDTLETDIDEKVDNEGSNLKITRERKRKMSETHVQGYKYLDTESVSKHQERTKVKNIIKIELGRYEIDTWYFSPFPSGYNDTPKLFFCEFCLSFMKRKEQLQRHMRKCDLKHPPGNEIYRNGSLSMFEVDGKKFKVYCQNLCYLAKLFLDQKTLYYDVDVFLFYILCECDDRGCHIVGYFSKERKPVECNLACLLTLPPYQRKGYGKFLIAFSYELSKKEGKVGTPEEPLSDLGQVTYTRYWSKVLLDILKKHKGNISVKELSCMTSISSKDISDTLKTLNLTHYCWKGERMVCPDPKIIDEHLKTAGRGGLQVDISKLKWTPHKWRD